MGCLMVRWSGWLGGACFRLITTRFLRANNASRLRYVKLLRKLLAVIGDCRQTETHLDPGKLTTKQSPRPHAVKLPSNP